LIPVFPEKWNFIDFPDHRHVAFSILYITNHCQEIDLETYSKPVFLPGDIENLRDCSFDKRIRFCQPYDQTRRTMQGTCMLEKGSRIESILKIRYRPMLLHQLHMVSSKQRVHYHANMENN